MLNIIYLCTLVISLVIGINGRAPERIKGGLDARIEEYPFMILITDTNFHFCGGMLISPRHILTAAHCVTTRPNNSLKPLSSVRVFLGNSVLGSDLHELQVERINVHNEWLHGLNKNIHADIAIITVFEDTLSSGRSRIARLADASPTNGMQGTMLGWGSKIDNGYGNKQMQKARTTIINRNLCHSIDHSRLPDDMFCTLGANRDVSFCNGDSGGPFVNDRGQVAGIVSFTTACTGEFANVFTDVYAHRPWIERVLRNEKFGYH